MPTWVQRGGGAPRLEINQSLTIAGGELVTPLELMGLGSAGVLLRVECSAPAWISFYVSAAALAADATRLVGADPSPSAGVVADLLFTAEITTLVLPPGVSWANQDTPLLPMLRGVLRSSFPVQRAVDLSMEALVLS